LAGVNVFLCQHAIEWENAPATCAHVKQLLHGTGIGPGSLVVLPEMFATGFSLNLAATARRTDPPGESFLREIAREHGAFTVGGVTSLADSGRGSNESVAHGPDGALLARYRKTFPFAPGGEAAVIEAGTGSAVFDLGGWRTALFVCYDLRFPEVFRRAAARGAELMIVIASWPDARTAHWVTLLQARAIENQCWVIGVNRTGTDPKFSYPGRSLVVSPMGTIETDAGAHECVARGELSLETLRSYREKLPFLRDLRTEFLGL
jgi:predicted amidohydrolase